MTNQVASTVAIYTSIKVRPFGGLFLPLLNFSIGSTLQFLVPQIEYSLGGSSKKGSHVYFLLIVAMVL